MTAHQYDQQANQVVCKISDPKVYTDNGSEANLYGLEPNFGCCTANMHQGWPKFASHLWGRNSKDGALVALAYAPSVVETKMDGKPVRIELKTDYPFNDTLTFTIRAEEKVRSTLRLRLPGWAKQISIMSQGNFETKVLPPSIPGLTGGVGGGGTTSGGGNFSMSARYTFGATQPTFLDLSISGQGEQTVICQIPMPVKIRDGFHNAVSIERGPLVYSLKIDTEFVKLRGKEPFADYEVFPESPWNYALVLDPEHPEKSITFDTKPLGAMPFSQTGAPVVAHAQGVLLPNWKLENNAAAPPPKVDPSKLKDQPSVPITLIPYGCTDLRVTEFPTLPPR